jgi:hypothetical protein
LGKLVAGSSLVKMETTLQMVLLSLGTKSFAYRYFIMSGSEVCYWENQGEENA